MRRFRRPALLAGLLATLANSACYAYQPATGTPHPASGVRFRLSPEGTSELARYLGPNVSIVTGQLTEILPNGTLTVAPQWVKTSNGVEQPWSGEGAVQFPREFVLGLEQRTYNARRTMLATVVVTVGLIALAAIALSTGGAHGGPPANGGSSTP